jgi:hypothetical protein
MSNNLSAITIPDNCYAAILDAVQRAIVDKYASKATRQAAFSAAAGTTRHSIPRMTICLASSAANFPYVFGV